MINMHNVREVTKYVNRNCHKTDIHMLDLHQCGIKSKINCQGIYIPSRSEVLAKLGISEQEDKLFQEQYKNV